MARQQHVIYVPGIGDAHARGQDKVFALWRLLGVVPHYHPVGWLGEEPFADKLDRLLAEIDRYHEQGDTVSLLGFSAGGSVVVNAFSARRDEVTAVVLISGWLKGPAGTSQQYFVKNPAFKQSLELLQQNLPRLNVADKQRLLTLNPFIDPVVPSKAGTIPGVRRWRTVAFGHVMSIVVGLTVYTPFIVRHLKRLTRSS